MSALPDRLGHATNELVAAAWGVYAVTSDVDGDGNACGQSGAGAFAWLASVGRPSRMEDESPRVINCPACLRLLAIARGPERTAALAVRADELEELIGMEESRLSEVLAQTQRIPVGAVPALQRMRDSLASIRSALSLPTQSERQEVQG